jgi:hypothetical protein
LRQSQNSPAPVQDDQTVGRTNNFQIEFLQPEEQARFNISPELKIQVLNRAADGRVLVYKVIKSEFDVISDPALVGSISPRQTLPVSD